IENPAAEYVRVSNSHDTSITSEGDSATLAAHDWQSLSPSEPSIFKGSRNSATLPPIWQTPPGNGSGKVSNTAAAERYAAVDRHALIARFTENGGEVWAWLLTDRRDLADAIDAADPDSPALEMVLRAG